MSNGGRRHVVRSAVSHNIPSIEWTLSTLDSLPSSQVSSNQLLTMYF